MPRTGQRPHCWKVQGDIPHKQYLAFLQMRAQANYREEEFKLTFEDFQDLWKDHWDMKGRAIDQYCLTRINDRGAWERSNVECVVRIVHLRRKNQVNTEKNNGKSRKNRSVV
jgi:hypothetical protein